MAAHSGRTDPSLEQALFERGYEFEFFQAVRLLARIFAERKPVGGIAKPKEEFARFGAQVTMAFPPSAVHEIERIPDSDEPAHVTVAFLGLMGTQGVLPFCYTEWMIARKSGKDGTMVAFFDLFNHRLLSLFYRAWEKHRPPVMYELGAARHQQPDPYTHALYDFIGLGTEGLRHQLRFNEEGLLLYTGLIAQRPISASALRGILRNYFRVPVEIEQCVGEWYELEPADRSYLTTEGEWNQLGEAAFLGEEVWNQQARFRIRLGPLALPQYLEFLPDREAMAKLVELTTFLVGQTTAFEVQMFLRAGEVPGCHLSDEGPDAPRLGWIGWLRTEDFLTDPGDAIFPWVN